MEQKNIYKPIAKVDIGVDKDTINDFARKYNLELEHVYTILNRYKQRKVVFRSDGDYWNVDDNGATLSIPHNGNIVYCVYRIDGNIERQVVAGIRRTDTTVILESVAPFDGYMLFLSDDLNRGLGGNLPDDALTVLQELSEEAETAVRSATEIKNEVARIALEKVGYITPQMFGAVGDGTTDDYNAFRLMFASAKDGDVISIPKGTYKISHLVEIRKSNITIDGNWSVIKGDTTQYNALFYLVGVHNVVVRNFEFTEASSRCIEVRPFYQSHTEVIDGIEKRIYDRDANNKMIILEPCYNIVLENLYGHDTIRDDGDHQASYMVTIGEGTSRVHIENVRWENTIKNSDCLRLKGDVSYITAKNMNGYCGDVFIAICTDEDMSENADDDGKVGHPVTNCTFENVYTENGNYSGLGIEVRRARSSLNNIRFTNCNFVANKTQFVDNKDRGQAPVIMATTTSGYPNGVVRSGTLDNVIFEGCSFEIGTHSDGDRPAVRVSGLTVKNCAFENCVFLNRFNTSDFIMNGIQFKDACSVYYSRIDGFVCKNNTTTKFNGVSFSADTITRGVSLTDCVFEGSSSTNPTDAYFVDIKSIVGTGRTTNVNISLNGCKCQNATALINANTAAGTITVNNFLRTTIPVIVNAGSNLKINDNTQDIANIQGAIADIHSADLNIINCGDSIARGTTENPSYAEQISSNVRNVAVSGAWLADHPTDTTQKAIWYQLASSALNDFTPDVILLEGGVNDFTNSVALGNVPTEPTEPLANERKTIIGGLRKLFYEAQTRYPNAKKYFISNHKIRTGGSYLPTKSYRDGTYNTLIERIRQTCEVYSIEFVDVYGKSSLNTYFDRHAEDYTIIKDGTHDGLHPNTNGYAFGYVPIIKRALGFSKE